MAGGRIEIRMPVSFVGGPFDGHTDAFYTPLPVHITKLADEQIHEYTLVEYKQPGVRPYYKYLGVKE